MGLIGIRRVLKLFEHRRRVAVFLSADPGQYAVGFLHPHSGFFRQCAQPVRSLPSRGGRMDQHPPGDLRPVHQAFHAWENTRRVAVIQVAFIGR